MSVLAQKNILVGVTGGIAAYKTPLLIRQLVKLNCNVKVVMTPSSNCLLYTSPSPRDRTRSRMPSSA